MPFRSFVPILLVVLGVAAGLAVAGVTALGVYHQVYADRIYPGVRVVANGAIVDLGGQTREMAASNLSLQFDRYLRAQLALRHLGQEWRTTPRELGARLDVDATVKGAFAVGRDGDLWSRVRRQVSVFRRGVDLPPPTVVVDDDRLAQYITRIARDVDHAPTTADMALDAEGKIIVLPSHLGSRVNVARSIEHLRAALESYSSSPLTIAVDDVRPPLAEGDLQAVRAEAERVLGSPLILSATVDAQEKSWTLDRPQLAELIELRASRTVPPSFELVLDDGKIRQVVDRIAPEIERGPRNARFGLEGGGLKVLRESTEGRRLEVGRSVELIRAALASDQRRVALPWQPVRPDISTAEAALVAFPDVIERASTVYGLTLPERMFNVELAASRLNGTVVSPGATFSFNDEVGEVSYRAGYKKGYGISQDGDDVVTIPSEGGGICQVATTLFQSVFWAGYPVVERSWHLYWIPRYGQKPRGLKGLDATIDQVYDANQKLLYALDLRWRNNTEAPVLILSETDGTTLTVSLLGRRPDWQVKVAEPKIDKVVKADRKAVRQPDASLAPGAELMVEHAEDGFQATIVRTIVINDRIADETRFVSTYRPSRNVYLVGAPAARSGTPSARVLSDDRPAPRQPTAGAAESLITPLPSIDTPTRQPMPARPASTTASSSGITATPVGAAQSATPIASASPGPAPASPTAARSSNSATPTPAASLAVATPTPRPSR